MESKDTFLNEIREVPSVNNRVDGIVACYLMDRHAALQNAYLVEALDYALKTIVLQSQGSPIRDLDERISHFEQILKENGK